VPKKSLSSIPQWKLDMWQTTALWKSCETDKDFARYSMVIQAKTPSTILMGSVESFGRSGGSTLIKSAVGGDDDQPNAPNPKDPEVMRSRLEVITNGKPDLKGFFEQASSDVVQKHEDSIQDIRQDAEQAKAGKTDKSAWRTKLREKRDKLVENSKEWILSAFAKAESMIDTLPEPIQEQAGNWFNDLMDSLTNWLSDASQKISQFVHDAVEFIKVVWNKTVELAKEAAEKIIEAWEYVKEIFHK